MSVIRITTNEFRAAVSGLKKIHRNLPRAVVSALNKAAPGIRTDAARKLRELYYVKHGEVLKKINVVKASGSRIQATIVAKDRAIRLINFSVNPKRSTAKRPRQLKAAVKRNGGRKPVNGAFIASVRGSHSGVFQRTKLSRHKKTANGIWSALPIDQLRGPAIPVMLSQPGVVQYIQTSAQQRIVKNMDHEIKRQVLDKVMK